MNYAPHDSGKRTLRADRSGG